MGSEMEGLFSGAGSSYDDLKNYLQQGQGMAQNSQATGQAGLAPYNQAGTSAIGNIQSMLSQMQGQNNGQWAANYQESPYAKYLTDTETNAMNNAAAGGGVLGTGANQKAVGTLANNITGSDMQNYFNNMQNQNQMQLGGYENVMNTGANAANQSANLGLNYSQLISQLMNDQGQASANQGIANQQGKNSAINGMVSGLML